MKKKHIFSGAAIVALSMFAASCSNEDTATSSETNNGQLTEFVGTMASDEEPVTRAQINNLYDTPVNTLDGLDVTRASMARTSTTDKGTFSWEAGDYVYVKDDSNWKKSTNTATAGSSFKFIVDGAFSGNNTYTVLYNGSKSVTTADQVKIETEQTQTAFGNTEHFKTSGDCAIGTAQKQNSCYTFKLTHKVAYLCFLPYSTDTNILNTYKIKKIAVVAQQALAGSYTVASNAFTPVSGTTSKTVTLNVGTAGLALSNLPTTAPKDLTNALYMVVAPGTGYFRVDVTLLDGSNTETLVSKTYASTTLNANTVYNIPLDITPSKSTHVVLNYSSEKLIQWNETAAQGTPTANKMAWYMRSNPLCDDQTLWKGPDGQNHAGGFWIKKAAVIKQANGNKDLDATSPDSENYNETIKTVIAFTSKIYGTASKGKPAASELKNYFFLPFLGGQSQRITEMNAKYGEAAFYSGSSSSRIEHVNFLDIRNSGTWSMNYDSKKHKQNVNAAFWK